MLWLGLLTWTLIKTLIRCEPASSLNICISRDQTELCGNPCEGCVWDSLEKLFLSINSLSATSITIELAEENNEFSTGTLIFQIKKDLFIKGLGKTPKSIWSSPSGLGIRFIGKIIFQNIKFRYDGVIYPDVFNYFKNVNESNAYLEIRNCEFIGNVEQIEYFNLFNVAASTLIIDQSLFLNMTNYKIVQCLYCYLNFGSSLLENGRFEIMLQSEKGTLKIENTTFRGISFTDFAFNFTNDNYVQFLNNTMESLFIVTGFALYQPNKMIIYDLILKSIELSNSLFYIDPGNEVEIARNTYSKLSSFEQNYYYILFLIQSCSLNIKSLIFKEINTRELTFFYSIERVSINIEDLMIINVDFSKIGRVFLMFNKNNMIIKNISITNYSSCMTPLVFDVENFIKFENVFFKNCSLINKEGMIYLTTNNTLQIINAEFINMNNKPPPLSQESYGGCFYIDSKNILNISKSVFIGISAFFSGGVLLASKQNDIKFNEIIFDGVKAQFGGAIYLGSNNSVIFENSLKIINIQKTLGGDFIRALTGSLLNFIRVKVTFEIGIETTKLISFNDYNLLNINGVELFLIAPITSFKETTPRRKTFVYSEGINNLIITELHWDSFASLLFWSISQEDIIKVTNCSGRDFIGDTSFLYGVGAKEIYVYNLSILGRGNKLDAVSTFVELKSCISIQFKKITIEGSYLYKGNIFSIEGSENATMEQLSVFNNTIILEGNIFNITQVKILFVIKSEFISNTGVRFGTVYLDDVPLAVFNFTKFINNTIVAFSSYSEDYCIIDSYRSRGGAIYLRNSSLAPSDKILINLDNSYFDNNSAESGQEIFFDYFDHRLISLTNNVFTNNATTRFSSFISKILVNDLFHTEFNSTEKIISFDKISPGNSVLIVDGYDSFDNLINISCFKDVNVSLTDPLISKDQKYINLKLSYSKKTVYLDIYLDRVKISDTFSNSIKIRSLSTVQLLNVKSLQNLYLTNITFDLNFTCYPGSFFSLSGLRCSTCPKNTFKLEYSIDNVCDRCPKTKMQSCEGGMNITLKRGYFLQPNSSMILKCRNNGACEKSNCSWKFDNTSFLCSKCKPGYGITRDWDCADCSKGGMYFFLALYILMILTIKGYSVNKGYKLTKNLKKSIDKSKNEFSKEYTIFNLASTNSCLKILSIHFSFIFSLLSYPFPSLEELDQASPLIWNFEPISLSFECLFKLSKVMLPPVYISIMLRFLTPVTIFVFWIFYYGTKILRKRSKLKDIQSMDPEDTTKQKRKNLIIRNDKDRKRFIDTLIIDLMRNHSFEAIILITITVCFDDLITSFGQILSPFETIQNETQAYRMLWEPDRLWWDGHNFLAILISLPALVLIAFVMPFYIIFQLKRFSNKNKNDETALVGKPGEKVEYYSLFFKYGYFYYPFNRKCYYYEIIYMLKRMVFLIFNVWIIPLISIHTKFESNIVAFINLEILCIWVFFLIHNFLKPYREELRRINNFESISFIILLTSFFFSSLLFNNIDPEDPASDQDSKRINRFLYAGICLSNACFFIYGIWILVQNERYNIKLTINEIKTFLKQNIKFCKLIIGKLFRRLKGREASVPIPQTRKGKMIGKVEEYFIEKLCFIKEQKIELNPLAEWSLDDITKAKVVKKDSKVERLENKLRRSYKKKIQVLKLRIEVLKAENKALRNNLKGFFQEEDAYASEERKIHKPGYNQGIKIKKSFPGAENTQQEASMTESAQVDKLEEEPAPNKAVEDMHASPSDRPWSSNRSKENLLEIDLRTDSRSGPEERLTVKELEKKFYDEVFIIFSKEALGESPSSCFLKVNLLIKNEFDTLSDANLVMQSVKGGFVKVNSKGHLLNKIEKFQISEWMVYIRPPEDNINFFLEGELIATKEDLTLARQISIPINQSDFIRLEKNLNFKDKMENKATELVFLEHDVQNNDFEHEVKKKLTDDDLQDDFWKESLKMNFPEIYTEEADGEKDEQKYKDSKDIMYTKSFAKSPPKKSIFMKKQTEKNPSFLSIEKFIFKSSRLVFPMAGVNLKMNMDKYGSDLVFKFSNLYFLRESPRSITAAEIKILINAFIESRNIS